MAQFGRTGTPQKPKSTASSTEISYLNPQEFTIGGTNIIGAQFLPITFWQRFPGAHIEQIPCREVIES